MNTYMGTLESSTLSEYQIISYYLAYYRKFKDISDTDNRYLFTKAFTSMFDKDSMNYDTSREIDDEIIKILNIKPDISANDFIKECNIVYNNHVNRITNDISDDYIDSAINKFIEFKNNHPYEEIRDRNYRDSSWNLNYMKIEYDRLHPPQTDEEYIARYGVTRKEKEKEMKEYKEERDRYERFVDEQIAKGSKIFSRMYRKKHPETKEEYVRLMKSVGFDKYIDWSGIPIAYN